MSASVMASAATATAAAAAVAGPAQQPFQCMVCFSRFTRHENLKRHAALHSRSQEDAALPCELCSATFSRPDLRHRHMRRKHPEHEESSRRTTKKTTARRQSSSARAAASSAVGGSDGGRSQEDSRASPPRSVSSSTAASQRMSFSRHSGDEGSEMDAGSVIWHTPSSYQHPRQHPMDQGLPNSYTDGSTLARSVSSGEPSIIKGPPQPQPTLMTGMEQIAPSTADLEHSLFGASLFKSTFPFDDQMLPMPILQSSAFDPTLGIFNFNPESPERLMSTNLSSLPDSSWFPSTTQIAHGCTLFFNHVSHFVPVLHQPTFDMTTASRPLVLAMLSLGYQYGPDPESMDDDDATTTAEPSGAQLSKRCFHRARVLVASTSADEETGSAAASSADDPEHDVVAVQTYLLLQICAMMYLCSNDSAYGLKMHSRMIALSRARRLMHPAPAAAADPAPQDLDSLWRAFAAAEARKRTSFAVHQVDALWYQLLSIPRSVSHLEIKHGLPCPEDFWSAASPAEWAHRQLVAPRPGPSVQYADAVRRFLAPGADLKALPGFDSYGAINIAQFLISSAREISGWSTMTGILSMDRFEILRASLDALRPFMQASPSACTSSPDAAAAVATTSSSATTSPAATTKATASAAAAHAALCEATWETAMIELQMWSPSHTGGIVEGSMDAVLDQSTHLAPSCEFLCESNTARAVQPHVDWFLRYLDGTGAAGAGGTETETEAPWITLYAYKAFLIAWQLVRGGAPGAMQAVGVADGDARGALAWARRVFGRRARWQLGKLTLRCLDGLQV